MERKYISITAICKGHQIDRTFVHALHEEGLVQIVQVENEEVLVEEQAIELEKMIRMHYQLEINVQGIDAIYNLLGQVTNLQQEVQALRSRLKRYED